MNKIALLATIGGAIALSACSGHMQHTASPGASKSDVASYKYKRDRVKEQIDSIPDWYFKQPESDEGAIWSVGTSVVPDLQMSVDFAVINAKSILADRINSRLRAQVKQFKAKVGSSDLDSAVVIELEKAVKNMQNDTDVSGYQLAEVEVVPHGTQYRAFVLLKYSASEAKKVLAQRLSKDRVLYNKLRANKAWKELDRNADAASKKESARRAAELDALKSTN
tara:strand:- start:2013 stop:2681 length:669 start_codon:yes stop_codon:yes gene_type:complete